MDNPRSILEEKPRGKLGDRVYQRTGEEFANRSRPTDPRLQERTNPPRNDPRTPAQVAHRARLTTANAEWQGFTPEQREVWNRQVGRLRYRNRYGELKRFQIGYRLFMSVRMRELVAEENG